MDNLNPRYARHYSLEGFGKEGQEKLTKAKVLVIGAGGLGCPALQYLAAAGVGTIGIADADTVSITNLQRQVLFGTDDIGKPKAEVAARRLRNLNPGIEIVTYNTVVTNANAWDIIEEYDVVIDCTDNFASRYTINDACVLLDKPLVFAAIYQYEGQVAVFNVADENGNKTSYRHLFPEPPDPMEVADCNEAGVLGVLPGVIGTLQATEAIKLITGIGEVLANRLLTINLLTYDTFVIDIGGQAAIEDKSPADRAAFEAMDYEWLCGSAVANVGTLEAGIFKERVDDEDTLVIDVREAGELPTADFDNVNIPLSDLNNGIPDIRERNIILFCQSGKRSLKAGQLLSEHFGATKNISHLKGGIIALHENSHE